MATARSAEQEGTKALDYEARGQTFEGRSKPDKIRLPPADISDLKLLFCELEALMGVKSCQGSHEDALQRSSFRPKKDRPAKGRAAADRRLSESTRAALALAYGIKADEAQRRLRIGAYADELTPGHDDAYPDCVEPGSDDDDGARPIAKQIFGDPFGEPSMPNPVVEIVPPKMTAAELAIARTPTYTKVEATERDDAWGIEREIVTVGDGRQFRTQPGVVVRKLKPNDGFTVFPQPVHETESEDCNRLESVERWVFDTKSATRDRVSRCRRALVRLNHETPLYLVALYLAYGPRPPHARDDLWERDVAPLVAYTGAAEEMRVASAQKLARARNHQRLAVRVAATSLAPSLFVSRDLAVERLRAAEETLARAKERFAANPEPQGADPNIDDVAAHLKAKRGLDTAGAALSRRRGELSAAELALTAAPPTRADVADASFLLGIDRETGATEVLRAALQAFPPAPEGITEAPVDKRLRLQRNRKGRTEMVDRLGKEAEQLLIAASSAYRRARAEIGE